MSYRRTAAVRFLLPVSVFLLVFGLYANAINNPLILFDAGAILRHPDVTEPQGLSQLWFHDARPGGGEGLGVYRPITILSLHLNARLTGMVPNATQMRITNMLLLGALGWLTAWWFGRYTRPLPAFIASYLLVAHPLNAELINHIVGRADLLAMLGIVGFVLAQRRALMEKRWTLVFSFIALIFALVAMGSKETGLFVLPVAAVQAWIAERSDAPDRPARRSVHLGTAVLLIAALSVYLGFRSSAVGVEWREVGETFTGEITQTVSPTSPGDVEDLTANPLSSLGFLERLPGSMATAWFYFSQIFAPDTRFYHTPAAPPRWGDPAPLFGLVVFLVTLVAVMRGLVRRHWLATVGVLVVGHFLMVGNLLIPAGAYAANRLSLPFTFAGAAVAAALLHRVSRHSMRHGAYVIVIFCTLLLGMGYIVVRKVNPTWAAERLRIHADYKAAADNPIAIFRYAQTLAHDRRSDDAVEYYRQAVEIKPESLQARTALAEALYYTSHYDEAVGHYRQLADQLPFAVRPRLRLFHLALIRRDLIEAQAILTQLEFIAPEDEVVLDAQQRLRRELQEEITLPSSSPLFPLSPLGTP